MVSWRLFSLSHRAQQCTIHRSRTIVLLILRSVCVKLLEAPFSHDSFNYFSSERAGWRSSDFAMSQNADSLLFIVTLGDLKWKLKHNWSVFPFEEESRFRLNYIQSPLLNNILPTHVLIYHFLPPSDHV